MRGHTPLINNTFKGLWARGNHESCPLDHGIAYSNVTFDQSSVRNRKLWTRFAAGHGVITRRAFIYNDNTGRVFIIYLDSGGSIYSRQIVPSIAAPTYLTSLDSATDMDVLTFNGRAYIATSNKQGYRGYFLYVYDGSTFRLTGADTPPVSMGVSNVGVGIVDLGAHFFGVSYETNTGFISVPMQSSNGTITPGGQQVRFGSIPIAPAGMSVVARRLITTKARTEQNLPPNGLKIYPSYFIPGGRIADNTTTTIDLNFTDSQLLEEASYLQDIYPHPPGGSCLAIYHNRMIVGAAGQGEGGQHIINVSRVNDLETFEVADGTLVIDPTTDMTVSADNGESAITGITEVQEYRDTLYAWKLAATYGIVDNGDVPSTWSSACLDQANGSFRNGIVTVLDSGGINIEYLIVANKNGLFVFNGLYNYPEVTWKIRDAWNRIKKNPYSFSATGLAGLNGCVHFVNDPLNKKIYCLVGVDENQPTMILHCDYSETNITDTNYFMNVKWSTFDHTLGCRPSAIVAYDVLKEVKLLGFNWETPNDILEGGGAGLAMETPTDTFSQIVSSLIRDDSESRILHFGGISISSLGNGTTVAQINMSLIESISGRKIVLSPLNVDPVNSKIKTIPTNFSGQKTYLHLTAKELNLNNIQIWSKPSYRTLPYNG